MITQTWASAHGIAQLPSISSDYPLVLRIRSDVMLKGAWILPVVMLVALILAAFFPIESFAAERNGIDWAKTPAAPKTEFKDLPGVVSEAERAQKPEYTCTTGIAEVYVGRGRYDTLYGDTMPRRVYHCETESGLTYTGTEMPNTQWVPGLNPHHLPK